VKNVAKSSAVWSQESSLTGSPSTPWSVCHSLRVLPLQSELIMIKKINDVKNFNAGKNLQTSSANSEHKHSEIECFSTLNERIIAFWLQHHSSSLFRFLIHASFKSFLVFFINIIQSHNRKNSKDCRCQLSISSVTNQH